jgi:hypothetical protein
MKYNLQISTFAERYFLNTPGPGSNLPYFEDPQVRMQGWGANMHNNAIGIESDLRGMTRKLNRDNVDLNQHVAFSEHGEKPVYPLQGHFVDESRATHPAWMYRDLEQKRWETPFVNPQANVEKRFADNLQTRILEKDFYEMKHNN